MIVRYQKRLSPTGVVQTSICRLAAKCMVDMHATSAVPFFFLHYLYFTASLKVTGPTGHVVGTCYHIEK
jgi:hypothetical protein